MASAELANLDEFAKAIKLLPEKSDAAFVKALNTGAEVARDLGRDEIFRQLNLPRDYIDKHLNVTQTALPNDLTVRISGTRRQTLLTRYIGGDRIKTVAAKSPRRKLKGDRSRGIRKGQKAAGIKAFKVQRGGAAKSWPGGFLIKLKGRNGWGLATRTGSGRNDYKVRSATSVGSAWKSVRDDVEGDALKSVEIEFKKEFKRIFR